MRSALTVLGLLMMVTAASANPQHDKAPSGQICTLKVSGMFCGACAKTVEKAAKKIDGVKRVSVSQPKGSADITYDPAKTSPAAIAAVISQKTPFKAEIAANHGKE